MSPTMTAKTAYTKVNEFLFYAQLFMMALWLLDAGKLADVSIHIVLIPAYVAIGLLLILLILGFIVTAAKKKDPKL